MGLGLRGYDGVFLSIICRVKSGSYCYDEQGFSSPPPIYSMRARSICSSSKQPLCHPVG